MDIGPNNIGCGGAYLSAGADPVVCNSLLSSVQLLGLNTMRLLEGRWLDGCSVFESMDTARLTFWYFRTRLCSIFSGKNGDFVMAVDDDDDDSDEDGDQ